MQLKKHYRRLFRSQWNNATEEQKEEMIELFGVDPFKKRETKQKELRERKER